MKKLFFLCCLSLSLTIFNSCKKDQELDLDNQITNTQKAETNQQDHTHDLRSCGSNEHMANLLKDPDYKRLHDLKFEKLKTVSSSRAACSAPTMIPIAVHYQGINNPDRPCLEALAISQLDVLNNDYKGTNTDISNWLNNASSSFPGINNGEACVEFCLATQNHPNGYNLANGSLAVTINQTTGDFEADWAGYINIFVQAGTGVLGYSPLGGAGNGDGVVIDATAFGTGGGCNGVAPGAPYDLGRTLTHEMGHYLLLDHIWGGNGGCNNDDNVSDTPVSTQPYYGCPQIGAASCSSTDMHMNYMDYTNDACMYMFSAGQAVRMESYLTTSLQNVIGNASSVCGGGGGGNPPTCNDGIQNGQETGVDCGGPTCPPCEAAPTCTDGIQNGQETGVDCGGPTCPPCQVAGCQTPTGLQHTVISTTEASVSWNAVTSATRYLFRYREQGASQWLRINTTSTDVFLSGLRPQTTYEYRLRSRCGSERSDWTSIQTFTTNGGGGGNCTNLSLQIVLDNYGSETTWDLLDDFNNVIETGGPYQDGQNQTVVGDAWCLADGCYTFIMYDDYGDGICCDYGQGSFEILDDNGNVVADSDGFFGYYEIVDFCVTNGTASRVASRKAPKEVITNKPAKVKMQKN